MPSAIKRLVSAFDLFILLVIAEIFFCIVFSPGPRRMAIVFAVYDLGIIAWVTCVRREELQSRQKALAVTFLPLLFILMWLIAG